MPARCHYISVKISISQFVNITGLPRVNDRKRRSQTAKGAVWHIPVIASNRCVGPSAPCLVTLLRPFPRGSHRYLVGKPGESLATLKTGCRKRADFKGYGRRDAVVRHIAIGEPRHGCCGPAFRVEPCPLKSALFREAEGQPVCREGLSRFSLVMISKLSHFKGR